MENRTVPTREPSGVLLLERIGSVQPRGEVDVNDSPHEKDAGEPPGMRAKARDAGEPEAARSETATGSAGGPAIDRPLYPGVEVLGHDRPLEVLRRLSDGDPLGVHGAAETRLIERALLLDLPRLTLRAMARAAVRAPGYLGRPELEHWIGARVDEAISDLLREDREEERRGVPPREPWDNRYAFLSEAMGVDPALARRLCILLNDLEDRPRHAFFHMVVLKKSLRRYVAEGYGPPDRVRESLRVALASLSRQEPTGQDPGPRPDDAE